MSKSNGTTYSVSIPPRGDSKDWQNFGNLFLTDKHGTLYLDVSLEQLDNLRASAQDGRVKAKIGVFRSKPKQQ